MPGWVTSNETPAEMRERGRRYLALARQATNADAADALNLLAHDTYITAAMVERGATADEPGALANVD